MGRFSGKSCRLVTMLSMTISFFLVELIVGFLTNSLALVADSFHMLSDVIALIVGITSVRISKWHTQKNTFGWARAEVLGAMVNSVFLVAMCFNIALESLQRFIEIEPITNPKLVLIVGSLGLLVNIIGLFLFAGHGHSHGGHGHSHGGGGHGHAGKHGHSHGGGDNMAAAADVEVDVSGDESSSEIEAAPENVIVDGEWRGVGHRSGACPSGDPDAKTGGKKKKTASSSQLNMRGVFLHVLGDALGSVVVIISSLIIWFVDAEWKYYFDPAMSLFMVCIILSTTIPLLKESGMILLQTVPTHMDVMELRKRLEKVDGVLTVHEFHVWQLAGNRIIASAHITCHSLQDYMRIAKEVKDFFHNEGIHSTTIQPEFTDWEAGIDRACVLECGPDKSCYPDTCCGSKVMKNGEVPASGDMALRQRPQASVAQDLATAPTAGDNSPV